MNYPIETLSQSSGMENTAPANNILNLIGKINSFLDTTEKEVSVLAETLTPILNYNINIPTDPSESLKAENAQKHSDLFEALERIAQRVDRLTVDIYNTRNRVEL